MTDTNKQECHYCHSKVWKDEGDHEIGSAVMDCHICTPRQYEIRTIARAAIAAAKEST